MPRKVRVEYAGAIYHVINRGDRREDIFLGDEDKLLDPEAPLNAYPWSSWPDYLKPASRRPVWLRVDRVMGENGLARDDLAARRRLESEMERQRELEQRKENPEWKRLRRGWCWGAEEFREEMLGRLEGKRGAHHYGEELKESDQQKAERMILEMLSKAGWNEAELKRRRKGDAEKARMARRLRHETTMTWRWIAERLKMGHWRAAANAARLTADGEL